MRQIAGAIVLILMLIGAFTAILGSLPRPIQTTSGMSTGEFFAVMDRPVH